MNIDLSGMVLVVTGAAEGIGKAIAEAAHASGARRMLLADIDGPRLRAVAERLGAEHVVCDLSDPAAPHAVAAAARAAFGRIDGLVNCAGITTRGGFLDATAEIWDRLFAVNARAPFFLMQEAIADMRARAAPGSIVNIQSMNAHCGTPELAVYAATKGALQTLTKNAANAHLPDRIRVNGINLGWVPTASEHRMQTETLGGPEDWAARAGAAMPLGRLLRPEDAARLCVYLLSPASAPMTGVSVDLDQTVVGAPR